MKKAVFITNIPENVSQAQLDAISIPFVKAIDEMFSTKSDPLCACHMREFCKDNNVPYVPMNNPTCKGCEDHLNPII